MIRLWMNHVWLCKPQLFTHPCFCILTSWVSSVLYTKVLASLTFNFLLPLQELLLSMGSLEFTGGKAEITEVTRCSGDVSVFYINCWRWFVCCVLLEIRYQEHSHLSDYFWICIPIIIFNLVNCLSFFSHFWFFRFTVKKKFLNQGANDCYYYLCSLKYF